MNKYAVMQKQLVRQGIILFVCVGLSVAAMMAADSMAEDAVKAKTEMETSLSSAQSELTQMRNQIDLSVGAEERFAEIQLARMEPSLAARTDMLVQLLQDFKTRYRLSAFKPLNLPTEAPSKLPQFVDKEYDVMVRDGVTIEFEAISDLHVYSFTQRLLHYAPGFMRLQSVDIQRKDDLSPQAVSQLQAGQNLGVVSAKLQFIWVGVTPKPDAIKAPGGTP